MAFVIPGIAVADVPNFVDKFYIEEFSKTTGIVAGTPFTVFDLEDVEIAFIIIQQDNTTPQANNLDHTITLDSEVFQILNLAANDETLYCLRPGNPGGAGPGIHVNPTLSLDASVDRYCGFPATDGTVTWFHKLLRGHSIAYVVNFDTIGAGQEFHADIYYWKKEAA